MKILEFMGKDHDRLDDLFKEFLRLKEEDLRRARPLFHEFKTGLQRHIVWEEEILFPIFEERTGMRESGPTAVMRQEHRQIKDFLERIHNTLLKADTQTDPLQKGLLEVLSAHNQKEEDILYPWIDHALSEVEIKEALDRMERLPPEKYNQCCQSHD